MNRPTDQDRASRLIAIFAGIAEQQPVVKALSCTPWASLGRSGERHCFILCFGALRRQEFLDEANAALGAVSIDAERRFIADWSLYPVCETTEGTAMACELLVLTEP